MVSNETLLPIFVVDTPIWDDRLCPWNVHVIDNGSSPYFTVHCSVTKAPANNGSSPNENGAIVGGTKLFENVSANGRGVYLKLQKIHTFIKRA